VWSISSCSRVALTAAMIAAAGRVGVAVERMALPAFTLSAGDGTAITSDRLVQPGNWALVYVAPQCAPCQAVLRSLDRTDDRAPARRVVIVVAGLTAEDLPAEAARYPNLSNATWLADPSNAVLQQIGQAGAPIIFGMRARTIEWSLAGVLMDATDARSILGSWLSQ
jgi:hypothetical protein